jgi:hypothetical protein
VKIKINDPQKALRNTVGQKETHMSDQRKEARKKLIAFTPVYGLGPKVLLGYLVDLTIRGTKVEGEHPAEINKLITLAIEFPSGLPEIPPSPFMISARVTRCNRTESPQYYNIGFEFTGITPEQARIIEAIINRYAFRPEPAE